MGDFKMSISLPLDKDGFLRRECPLCCREFKLLLEEKELSDLAQKGIESFLLEEKETENNSNDSDDQQKEYICPYCGQASPDNSWWTKEQLAYINIFAKNIMAKLLNEHFIHPLQRKFSSNSGPVQFKGKEMEAQEPWISPESDDMEVFELKCCNRKMKICDDWKGKIYCFFCGFPF
jgi:hypothetical protein